MREGTVEGRGGSFTLIMGPPISSSLYVHVWWPLQVRSSHLVHHGSTSVTTRRSSLSRLEVHPQRELRERVSERARVCVSVPVSRSTKVTRERGGGV